MTSRRRNIELKYRCSDPAALRLRAAALGACEVGLLEQEDTFFPAPHARLKLRMLGDGRAELISYSRPDHGGARGSDYRVCPVDNPGLLAATLADALGTAGVVRKQRWLFRYRQTRIHLDEVAGLGTFVELETVMNGQSEDEARGELLAVAAALALDDEEPVAVPYVELLRRASTQGA